MRGQNKYSIGVVWMKHLFITILVTLILLPSVSAGEMIWGFKSPAFHYGNGYSSHVLSVEQLQHNRKQDLKDKAECRGKKNRERIGENTTLNKFIKNVESRIYATLSKQMVDSMFADCAQQTVQIVVQLKLKDLQISWVKDAVTGEITLTIVIEEDGSTTTITIPGAGEFNF